MSAYDRSLASPMGPRATRPGANGARGLADTHAEVTSADLFALLWEALADLLGTAATASLLRRAARRAMPGCAELAELAIVRDALDYRHTVPPTWNDASSGTQALRQLVGELLPLLTELTGPLVVNHLARIQELRDRGIVPPQGNGA